MTLKWANKNTSKNTKMREGIWPGSHKAGYDAHVHIRVSGFDSSS